MNGGFGSGAARNEQAWQWLAESDPDVALLQEAVLPAWARDLWPVVVHAPKYLTKRWGSAIVSRHNDFEEFRPADDGGHARLPVDGH
jgi:hypothetical protein